MINGQFTPDRRPAVARFRDVEFPSWRAAAVMFALLQFTDSGGLCWPSVALLAQRTKLSKSTVQRGLRELEMAGLMRVDTPAKRHDPASYVVPLAASTVADTRGVPQTPLDGLGVSHRPARGVPQTPLYRKNGTNERSVLAWRARRAQETADGFEDARRRR